MIFESFLGILILYEEFSVFHICRTILSVRASQVLLI